MEMDVGTKPSPAALGIAVALALTASAFAHPRAQAATGADDLTAQAATIADSVAGRPETPQEVNPEGISTDVAQGTISVSIDPDEGITAADTTGTDITLGIPGKGGSGSHVAGNVVYPDIADDATAVARPTRDGAQALIVIHGNDAPERYRFPIEVNGQDAGLRESGNGGIQIFGLGNTPAATIAPPWATDADGAPVPTHYEIDGSSILQIVDHQGAAYPVTADPKHSWGYITGTAYYNRAETRALKTRSYAYVVAAGLCAAFGSATAGAACAVGAAVAAQWSYVATNAYGDGRCVKIKVPTMWAYAYSGGNCK
jgi:hypothetical protein